MSVCDVIVLPSRGYRDQETVIQSEQFQEGNRNREDILIENKIMDAFI